MKGSSAWRMVLAVMVGLAGVLIGHGAAQAQSSCDDPFGGSRPRFSLSFWDQTDFCKHSVDYDEIISGGPPPNGIPPIYDPAFESVDEARSWLSRLSPVIAFELNGDARAYPLAILMYHEIVNDVVGGVPVAVTFCPLCNAALVFDRRVGQDVLAFGTTGNLRGSDLVMWDDLTQSWWQQFTGEAIVGAYTGTQLEALPSQVVGFGQFVEQYPDGQVLQIPADYSRPYGSNPYVDYDTAGTPLMPAAQLDAVDDRLPLTEVVLGALVRGEAVAYPFSVLSREMAVNDTIGGEPVLALWQPGVASALDEPRIDRGRDIGTAALFNRTVEGTVLTFVAEANGTIRDTETGSAWNAFGTAVSGPLTGTQLQRYVSNGHFWFAWVSFRPETRVYGLTE